MLKTKAIRKIFTTTLSMFIILTIFTFPLTSKEKNILRTNLEIEDVTNLTTDKVYLLNKDNLLVRTDIFLDGKNKLDKAKNIIIIDNRIKGINIPVSLVIFLKSNKLAITAIIINTRQISQVGISCKYIVFIVSAKLKIETPAINIKCRLYITVTIFLSILPPVYSAISIISLLWKGSKSLWTIKKKIKVSIVIYITFKGAEEELDVSITLGISNITWLTIIIITKKVASI